jgi:hypothetical protein
MKLRDRGVRVGVDISKGWIQKVTRFLYVCAYSYNNVHVLTEVDQNVFSKIEAIEHRKFKMSAG